MKRSNWGELTAQQVSQMMTFEKDNFNWRYRPKQDDADKSMAQKQAEGVAYLWSLLSKQNLAILADEVGMGKTFQAIGVILNLWKIKPNAKVLVIAPNREICNHWKREFKSFLAHHIPKGSMNKEALIKRLADPRTNLSKLVASFSDGGTSLFFTTIHSFSRLPIGDVKDPYKADKAKEIGQSLHQETKGKLGDDGFDLLIVDEAHYLRSVHGGSQKVAGAQGFFGDVANPLAQRVLLISATPTHSSPADVKNILSYFCDAPTLKGKDTKTLLEQYALRRFRLMKGGNGQYFSKYDYRYEHANPVSFEGNPDAELFFGLYQRELVKKLKEERKSSNANKRYLYGYLEGFESFGEYDGIPQEAQSDNEEADNTKDTFSKAGDSALLHELSQAYFKKFGCFPEHPKYNDLVDRFTPKVFDTSELEHIKHLVFVRRIPSVRELTKRVNRGYDDLFAPKIAKSVGFSHKQIRQWKKSGWSRNYFNQQKPSGKGGLSGDDTPSNDDDSRLTSKVANLFVVKKNEKNTLCTNIGLRFKKAESIFSLFIEPGSDHLAGAYHYYYAHEGKDRPRAIYSTAAVESRMGSKLANSIHQNDERVPFNSRTVWVYLVPKTTESNRLKLARWKDKGKCNVENFANYFKAGVLYASPVIVELFIWLCAFEKDNKNRNKGSAEKRYTNFLNYVEPKIDDSMLLWYFNKAIETFEEVCEKIEGIELNDWEYEWRSLKTLSSPALFASGQSNNRQRLITGFNTPFYPNVLVATSVFKEGVNLHMQCNQVHHYGIAGNTGDNEQRVGRVDRLFGKVNRLLEENDNARLDIHYPYLENSLDEDQLASFLEKKFKAEAQLDACLDVQQDGGIEINTADNWRGFLKSPELGRKTVKDPYPAKVGSSK